MDRPARFKNWAAGEPNNHLWPLYSEECAEIEDASGRWNDETCTSLRSYVCQKSKSQTLPSLEATLKFKLCNASYRYVFN